MTGDPVRGAPRERPGPPQSRSQWRARWRRGLMALGLLVGLGLSAAPLHAQTDDFLDPSQAFQPTAAMADPLHLDVHYAIADGYYMYQERFEVKVEDADGQLLLYRRSSLTPPDAAPTDARWDDEVALPEGEVKYDPTFDKDMEVYHHGVTLRIPLRTGAAAPLTVAITGQGCADQGLCYPPMTQALNLTGVDDGYQVEGPLARPSVPPPSDSTGAGGTQSTMAGSASPSGIASSASPLAGLTDGGGASDASPANTGEGATASAAASQGTEAGRASGASPAYTGGGAAESTRASSSGATPDVAAAGGWLNMSDVGMAGWLSHAPLWQIVLLSLAFGALLSLTPCVLPMIPILLAVIAGPGVRVGRLRGTLLAAAYVLGMSLVYTALGVLAGLLGAGLAAWLQSPWVLGTFAVLLALFALAMLDVFTLQVPAGVQSALQARVQRLPGGHAGGAFFMGMVSALIVGPCVAAPLAGVLLFISQTHDVVIGGTALFAMAWGEGLLLLLVGAGSGALLPKAGHWMNQLKAGFGLLLLATAWWMGRPLLPDGLYVTGWVLLALWAALLIWHSVQGGIGPLRLLGRAVAVMLAGWALAQGAGLLAGGRDMLRPLTPFAGGAGHAAEETRAGSADPAAIRARFTRIASLDDLNRHLETTDKPVMLDFYADWCVSCLEMEKFTFSDPGVARRMSNLLLLQADVTKMTADDKALLQRFDLFGPPGILFFDARGQAIPSARVVGFRKAADFARVLDTVLGSTPAQ